MASYQQDAYIQQLITRVSAINERGGIILQDTVFYPTGGGQPGDSGLIRWAGGEIRIATTVRDRETGDIVHVPFDDQPLPEAGTEVTAIIDWQKRYRHMRMHTALHLLSAVIPCGVTGGQIGSDKSRLDFDVGERQLDKEAIEIELNRLMAEDHRVSTRWVDDTYLENNPELVKTLSVQPPKGAGKIRLLQIGEDDAIINLQPCGGTHVKRTGEIGQLRVLKIENKGKRNRRVQVALAN